MNRSDAPQSREEVEPIERALRQLDDAIRIEWEPLAVMAKRGGYDAQGKVINPVYDGRWAVVKKEDPYRTTSYRPDTRICFVTETVVVGTGAKQITAMQEDGPYAPVGWWLVDVMRSWDRANREAMNEASAILDDWNTQQDAAALVAGQDGEAERLEAMFMRGTMRGGVSTSHPVRVNLTTLKE